MKITIGGEDTGSLRRYDKPIITCVVDGDGDVYLTFHDATGKETGSTIIHRGSWTDIDMDARPTDDLGAIYRREQKRAEGAH